MSRAIAIQPITAEAFAPFGDLLRAEGEPDRIINQGLCGRHHDLARIDVSDGRTGISLFDAVPRSLPYTLDMMERHPLGSQAFLPMSMDPFLVIVAPDQGGVLAVGAGKGQFGGRLAGVFAKLLHDGGNIVEVFHRDAPVTLVGS